MKAESLFISNNMKYNVLHEKTLNFSVRIVKLYKYLLKTQKEYDLPRQILRCGTSIGANNAEAMNAISKSDYRSKSFIALKEARESLYWINLLHRNGYLEDVQFQSIYADCEELVRILMTRCKKLNEG